MIHTYTLPLLNDSDKIRIGNENITRTFKAVVL